MRFSAVAAALVLAVTVSAQQNFTVIVGGNDTVTYSPSRLAHRKVSLYSPLNSCFIFSVNASVGDTIAFQL